MWCVKTKKSVNSNQISLIFLRVQNKYTRIGNLPFFTTEIEYLRQYCLKKKYTTEKTPFDHYKLVFVPRSLLMQLIDGSYQRVVETLPKKTKEF